MSFDHFIDLEQFNTQLNTNRLLKRIIFLFTFKWWSYDDDGALKRNLNKPAIALMGDHALYWNGICNSDETSVSGIGIEWNNMLLWIPFYMLNKSMEFPCRKSIRWCCSVPCRVHSIHKYFNCILTYFIKCWCRFSHFNKWIA